MFSLLLIGGLLLLSVVNFSIAKLLSLFVAALFIYNVYKTMKRNMSGEWMGIKIMENVTGFIRKNNIPLTIVIIIGFFIWFRELFPSNIVTSVFFLILSPFEQIGVDLSGFLGKTTGSLIKLGVQMWFVYVIVSAITSSVGKRL